MALKEGSTKNGECSRKGNIERNVYNEGPKVGRYATITGKCYYYYVNECFYGDVTNYACGSSDPSTWAWKQPCGWCMGATRHKHLLSSMEKIFL
jgi:hypothetical protein